jgi:two-component system, chemotaxis family, CheB/CheR fusion protein
MDRKEVSEKADQIYSNLVAAKPKYIVAIGASAGGLDAIKELLKNLPKGLNASYVIIQHLSPDFDSVMDEILVKETKLKVEVISNEQIIKPDTIYVMRKRQDLCLDNNQFKLSDIEVDRPAHPIDAFFKSVAQEWGDHGVAIVLSGSGTDGSSGAQYVHDEGGLVIAQSPQTCTFPSMPESVIATNCVGYISEPKEIGQQLKNYFIKSSQSKVSIKQKRTATFVKDIFSWLKNNSKVDFSAYKTRTLERRFSHRMSILGINDIEDYRDFLIREPEEVEALANDLLIGVTEFFRDSYAWEALTEKVLMPLILERSSSHQLRIWSVGCSTGEESYSLAINIEKVFESLKLRPNYKVFATDIDKRAIRIASEGRFSINKVNGINDNDLMRYFHIVHGYYCIKDEVREKLLFTRHNILEDPPFSKIDLVVCRNLLIYFQPTAQEKIMNSLVYSMRNNGYLMLGMSENASSVKEYIFDIDRANRIFQKIQDHNKNILSNLEIEHLRRPYLLEKSKDILVRPKRMPVSITRDLKQRIQARLLEVFSPPTIVIDDNLESLYYFGNVTSFLQKDVEANYSQHYSEILLPNIVTLVTPVLEKVIKQKKRICINNITLGGSEPNLNIDIRSFEHPNEKSMHYYTISISFTDSDESTQVSHWNKSLGDSELKTLLEERDDELIDARLTISEKQGDIHSLGEELQSSNEELIASNEELQSTNEELHSVNEELFTVNAELQDKIEQLEEANSDLDNILALSSVGVVYLDNHLRIRRYTSEIRRYIKLLPVDISRPLFDISSDIDKKLLEEWLDIACKQQQRLEQVTNLLSEPKTKVKVVISPCFDKKRKSVGIILMLEELPEALLLN